MDSLRIFGVYAANLIALAFSFSEVNVILQFFVMITTLAYTLILIYKSLKK